MGETHTDGDDAGVRAPVRVEVMDGPDRGLVPESDETVAIGTSPDNEIVLSDPTVSRYHLELHCEEGVLVRDLGSRNGTFVNDVRIREAIVPIGARVRLGGSVLLLLDAGAGRARAGAAGARSPGAGRGEPGRCRTSRAPSSAWPAPTSRCWCRARPAPARS